MIKNYLKVALRNLWKSRGFTVINVTGLAAGLRSEERRVGKEC